MGNCLFGGLGDEEELSIKVIKSDGGVVKYYSTVTAGSVSDEFSGHSIFSAIDLLCKPLPRYQELVPGQSYYLLPKIVSDELKTIVGNCHVRSNSESLPAITPYRMSLDYNHMDRVLKRSYTDVFSRNIYTKTRQKEKKTRRRRRGESSKGGMWKVKLVINTEELLQILSEDGRTNELIESVRAVANGENVVASCFTNCLSENDLLLVHV